MKRFLMTIAALALLSTTAQAADPPDLRLTIAYATYAHVAWCQGVREGYAAQAISRPELIRAHAVVKLVEEQSTKADPSINTDKLWELAMKTASRNMEPRKVDQPGFREVCQDVLRQLFELSPVPVYSITKP